MKLQRPVRDSLIVFWLSSVILDAQTVHCKSHAPHLILPMAAAVAAEWGYGVAQGIP